MTKKKISVLLGGDKRMDVAAKRLCASGYEVISVGFGEDAEGTLPSDEVLRQAGALILPTPCSMDESTVYAPGATKAILWREIRDQICDGQLLIGGKIPTLWREEAQNRGALVFDVTESDRLAWKNAVPTAEGALAIALMTMPRTLYRAKVVVLGYGRIAQCLVPMLLALGARVTVCARSESARAEALSLGCEAASMEELNRAVAEADWICNTIPALVLKGETLGLCSPETLILDLASKPGGVDWAQAEKLGLQVIRALGLPGKVAPISAGEYLAEEILEIFKEAGE